MKIFTLNVCFYKSNTELNNDRITGITSIILKENPDIIVLTEIGINKAKDGTDGKVIVTFLQNSGFACYDNTTLLFPTYTSVLVAVKKEKYEKLPDENDIVINKNNPEERTNRWVEIAVKDKHSNSILRLLGVLVPPANKKKLNESIKNKNVFFDWIIEKFIKPNKDKDAILIGDLNEDFSKFEPVKIYGKVAVNHIAKLNELSWFDSGCTWKEAKLDYAFLSQSLMKRLNSSKTLHDTIKRKFSDHSALVIEIDEI